MGSHFPHAKVSEGSAKQKESAKDGEVSVGASVRDLKQLQPQSLPGSFARTITKSGTKGAKIIYSLKNQTPKLKTFM